MRLPFLAVLIAVAALSCGDTHAVGHTKLTIESPLDGSTTLSFKPFRFSVTAINAKGIQTVELWAGNVLVKTCDGQSQVEASCVAEEVLPTDFAAQVQNGFLDVKAKAVESKGGGDNEQVNTVAVKPLRVAFVQPVASGDPAVATVTGTSPMELEVESEVGIKEVQTYLVDSSGDVKLRFFTDGPYEADMEWSVMLNGKGDKVIKAVAIDESDHTDTALLNVHVQ
jgi:hypothetical protein